MLLNIYTHISFGENIIISQIFHGTSSNNGLFFYGTLHLTFFNKLLNEIQQSRNSWDCLICIEHYLRVNSRIWNTMESLLLTHTFMATAFIVCANSQDPECLKHHVTYNLSWEQIVVTGFFSVKQPNFTALYCTCINLHLINFIKSSTQN